MLIDSARTTCLLVNEMNKVIIIIKTIMMIVLCNKCEIRIYLCMRMDAFSHKLFHIIESQLVRIVLTSIFYFQN